MHWVSYGRYVSGLKQKIVESVRKVRVMSIIKNLDKAKDMRFVGVQPDETMNKDGNFRDWHQPRGMDC